MFTSNRHLQQAIRLALLACLLCGIASANSTIIATGVDLNRGHGLTLNNGSGDFGVYFAGVVFIQIINGGNTYNRETMCVDLFIDIYLGSQYDTNILRPSQVPGRNLPRASWVLD